MDYKEKYEQAINFIKDLYPHTSDYVKEKLDDFFPELKESEDDRIRKWIVKQIKTYDPSNIRDAALAWLEKQGEKKPAEWSEEDERMFKNTIALIETLEDYNKAPNGFGDVKFWLKSLKSRVKCADVPQQPDITIQMVYGLEKIDIDAMVEHFRNRYSSKNADVIIYRQGILDTIEKLKTK